MTDSEFLPTAEAREDNGLGSSVSTIHSLKKYTRQRIATVNCWSK
jgi:hypothetical protein